MQNADKGTKSPLDGSELRIALVRARFNEKITEGMARACVAELQSLGVQAKHIHESTVPGALEVPLALQVLAESNEFDALVAIGCVIRGETYHFELVANESGSGVMRVSLDHEIPIANAILTVENQAQAEARVEEKGRDAARVAVEMAHLMKDIL